MKSKRLRHEPIDAGDDDDDDDDDVDIGSWPHRLLKQVSNPMRAVGAKSAGGPQRREHTKKTHACKCMRERSVLYYSSKKTVACMLLEFQPLGNQKMRPGWKLTYVKGSKT